MTPATSLTGPLFGQGSPEHTLTDADARAILAKPLGALVPDGTRVLVIIPDATRTAPIPLFFRLIHEVLSHWTAALDFLVALGTHPLMSEEARCQLVGITREERSTRYRNTSIFNHRWDQSQQLTTLDTIPAAEVRALSGGRLDVAVPVTINRMVLRYDTLLICGPTYPHEVVGFSGGNKYFFPGISGPDMINVAHWLGALLTSRALIGTSHTPVRAFIDRAAQCIPRQRLCASLVVQGSALNGLYVGSPEAAWKAAADLSRDVHIRWVDRPYQRALAIIPPRYDDLWTGAKGMYKLEPVIADGGEIVLFAPHIDSLSYTHGEVLRQIGYHGSAYIQHHWDRYKHHPWAVLAHSAHVRGEVSVVDGHEKPRIRVTLASQVPEVQCSQMGLGYLDPDMIDLDAWHRSEEDLVVPNAGEQLYRLRQPHAAP